MVLMLGRGRGCGERRKSWVETPRVQTPRRGVCTGIWWRRRARSERQRDRCQAKDVRIDFMARRKLRVGFDFDGVIVYNPLRILRLPISLFKRIFLCERRLKFYYPKTRLEKWFWILLHETSFFPAVGFAELKKMLEKKEIEAYLITARYSFLEKSFYRWLKKHKLDKLFKGYYLNKNDDQPYKFKERIIKGLKLDVYIDDNWDIVQYLESKSRRWIADGEKKIEIYWIYNILDRFKPYPRKHPYLREFLQRLRENKIGNKVHK